MLKGCRRCTLQKTCSSTAYRPHPMTGQKGWPRLCWRGSAAARLLKSWPLRCTLQRTCSSAAYQPHPMTGQRAAAPALAGFCCTDTAKGLALSRCATPHQVCWVCLGTRRRERKIKWEVGGDSTHQAFVKIKNSGGGRALEQAVRGLGCAA